MRSLGISIGAQVVRAVIVDGGELAWHGSRPVSEEEPLEAALSELLQASESPMPKRFRVALGRDLIQVRSFDANVLTDELKAANWFRRNGSPPRLAVMREKTPKTLVAATSESTLQQVESALEHAGLQPSHIQVGTSCAVRAVSPSRRTSLSELHVPHGDAVELIEICEGRIASSRLGRQRMDLSDSDWSPELLTLESESADYAVAFGAASDASDWRFILPHAEQRAKLRTRRLSRVVFTLLLLSGIAAFASLRWRISKDRTRLSEQRAAMAPVVKRFTQARQRTAELSAQVSYANDFAEGGVEPRAMLRGIANSLPADVVVESIEVDAQSRVRLTASAESALRAAASVEGIGSASAVRLSGVSGEPQSGGERFSLDLQWARP